MKILSGITVGLVSGVLLVSAAERVNLVGIAGAARAQIGKTERYDPGYRTMKVYAKASRLALNPSPPSAPSST